MSSGGSFQKCARNVIVQVGFNKSRTKEGVVPSTDSLTLVSKIESIEEHQALEKDCLDVVNKQWGPKLEAIEALIKMLLSQAQEKPSSAFVQTLGIGYGSGKNFEPPGRPLKNFSSGTELICFGCGEGGHFQNNCE